MPNYVLTGAPGAGKTAILRQLELNGHAVVEEAATDVIALEHALGVAEPWTQPAFVDKIVALQRQRELAAAVDGTRCRPQVRNVFFDRSVLCTVALSRFLGAATSALLAAEVDRVLRDWVYSPTVFFVRGQGFVAPTAARRISVAEAVAFEHVHEQVYREYGFDLIDVAAGPLPARLAVIEQGLRYADGANQVSGSSSTSPAPADASAPTTSVLR